MTNSAVVNFRTRTGQARRARTRANILSTAFALFDERGVDQVTVEDVRESAGLARGSFYNYFLTYEHMLKELAAAISRLSASAAVALSWFDASALATAATSAVTACSSAAT